MRNHLHRQRLLLAPLTLCALAACSTEPGTAEPAAAPVPYQIVASHHQTMEWILEPAADVIWDSAGFEITEAGEVDLSPQDDAGWEHVAANAMLLAESANLLMLPGRSAGPDWNEYSVGLIESSRLALEAAEAQDAEALFDAGGRIYQVCRACHQQYWVEDDDQGASTES